MAIVNPNKKPFIIDEDKEIYIGLDYPIAKSEGNEGYFKSTKTTLKAAKVNVKSLLLTQAGERYMQPTLGLNLKKYLFEQYTSDLKDKVQTEITEKFNFWLPFVEIQDIQVVMKDGDGLGGNTLYVKVVFNITKDRSSTESVEVSFTQ